MKNSCIDINDNCPKLSKNFLKEIENEKVLEEEFDIKMSRNVTPQKSKSLSKNKKKKKKKNAKKLHKNNSDMEYHNISKISNKIQNNNNNENVNDKINDMTDKTQLRITDFTTMKKNNNEKKIFEEKDDKFCVTAVYGGKNDNSTEIKMNELKKMSKKKKNKKISTQNLLNDLNNMEKSEEEYNFEFLNKYEKFDNDTNSMFDLFNVPKKNDIMNLDKNNKNMNNTMIADKNEDNRNNKNSELKFLNTIEDLNNFL